MHDATEGGVVAAVLELASAAELGAEIDLQSIPIARETREICKFFKIDPLISLSGGSLVITCKPCKTTKLLAKLKAAEDRIKRDRAGKLHGRASFGDPSSPRLLLPGSPALRPDLCFVLFFPEFPFPGPPRSESSDVDPLRRVPGPRPLFASYGHSFLCHGQCPVFRITVSLPGNHRASLEEFFPGQRRFLRPLPALVASVYSTAQEPYDFFGISILGSSAVAQGSDPGPGQNHRHLGMASSDPHPGICVNPRGRAHPLSFILRISHLGAEASERSVRSRFRRAGVSSLDLRPLPLASPGLAPEDSRPGGDRGSGDSRARRGALFFSGKTARLAAVLGLSVGLALFTSLNLLRTYPKENWKGAAQYVSRKFQPEDSVQIYREFYAIALERYIPPGIRVNRIRLRREAGDEDLSEKLARSIKDSGEKSRRIYLVLAGSDVPPSRLLSLLKNTMILLEEKSFYGLDILVLKKSHPEGNPAETVPNKEITPTESR